MMFTIRSGSMTAVIDSVGAQLMSLQSVDSIKPAAAALLFVLVTVFRFTL